MAATPARRNQDGYRGPGIDIGALLDRCRRLAEARGWAIETLQADGSLELLTLHRSGAGLGPRLYISAGIHGDEPAGPTAAERLLAENRWPENASLWLCPCLNPSGFLTNRRENANGIDLNRDYLSLDTPEVRAHVSWLHRQPRFDLCMCLHEDWESHGFYLYELNPDSESSLAEDIIKAVAMVCPIDPSAFIDGRPASGGIIRPSLDPNSRPQWPEAFHLIQSKTRLSYTLESPSELDLPFRAKALVKAVQCAAERFAMSWSSQN